MAGLNRVLGELRRRNVLRLVGLYIVGCWLILQISDVLLEIIGAPEGTLRMVAMLLVLGFPLAVVIAWIYDLTPAGVVRTDTHGSGEDARVRLTWPWIGFLLLLGALALIAYGVASREQTGGAPAALSIAVLPFSDLSPAGDNQYFSDGLSEALMDSLSRVPGLQVVARTSSFAYRDPGLDVREVARALEVASLVEGSVRKSAEQLRISARLVDGRTGRQLWSASFDGTMQDIFTVQDTIARGIADALQIRLLGSESLVPVETLEPQAYEAYLRGRAELRREGTPESVARAIEHFREALEIERTFLPAMAGMCTAYWEQYSVIRDTALADQAIQACDEAAAGAEPPPELLVALGGLYRGTGQLDRSLAVLYQALELNPNDAEAHASLGESLRASGNVEAARHHHLRAIELDPAYWRYHWNLGRVLVELGQWEEAAARIQRAIRLQPDSPAPYYSLGGIYFYQGEYLKAADAFRQSIERHPNPMAYSNAGTQYFYAGDYVQSEEMFLQAVSLAPSDFRYQGFLAESLDLQGQGRRAESLMHYERAVELAYQQLAINPGDNLCRAALAGYLARLGRVADARRELDQLQQQDLQGMLIKRALAMAYLALGEHRLALRYLQEAVAEGYPAELLRRDPRHAVLESLAEYQALLSGVPITEKQ